MGDVEYLTEAPGEVLQWGPSGAYRATVAPQTPQGPSLSGPAPVYSSHMATPLPPDRPPQAAHKPPATPKREMTHDELMAWANKAIAKVKAQEGAQMARGPAVNAGGTGYAQGVKSAPQPVSVPRPPPRMAPVQNEHTPSTPVPPVVAEVPAARSSGMQNSIVNPNDHVRDFSEELGKRLGYVRTPIPGRNVHPLDVQAVAGKIAAAAPDPDVLRSKGDAAAKAILDSRLDTGNPLLDEHANTYGALIDKIGTTSRDKAISAQKAADNWLKRHSSWYARKRLDQQIDAAKWALEPPDTVDLGDID